MENNDRMIEQLQMEMIIAKENQDEDLYQKLVLIHEKLKKELDEEE